MQIYGYPGERVDFVSASGSAGAIFFGDSRALVEEFFGPAHQAAGDVISYFNGAVALTFEDGGVADVIVKPHLSREKIDVFQAKEKLTGLTQNELAQLAQGPGVSVEFTDRLETVTFARR
ncbi:hypothetical protein [Corynebacterium sp. HMSC04H06]|uniref:hypothetical protein n=1 Tax=Corynebacterium sp. HMSC04H06 TaxID=1581050 RepID=UPI0008A5A2B5|nr:hypothetical protein [Corynebacterium sp. HMSC04H06]OFS23517.1 hypothetical protein HMPREF3067_01250 [Corynebacterium sp. HMSC04H06]